MKPVGEIIREKREEKGWLLRHLAAEVDIDQALLSKIERGSRKATKEQIIKFASALGLNKEDLILQYLSENIAYEIIDESNALDILHIAEDKIAYLQKQNKNKQR
jgi:HTH-type transcriptional regulator, competence development regulator